MRMGVFGDVDQGVAAGIEDRLEEVEARLRRAFVARYGVAVGLDVAAETMAWAWEHRAELNGMSNPLGYLYRVGQGRSRRQFRWQREQGRLPLETGGRATPAWTEPKLPQALNDLGEEERTAIVLVHCFEWTYAEVADLVGVPVHTVRNRIHRGMTELRTRLGVER